MEASGSIWKRVGRYGSEWVDMEAEIIFQAIYLVNVVDNNSKYHNIELEENAGFKCEVQVRTISANYKCEL